MNDVDPQHLRLLEAVLFSSAEAMTEQKLAERLPEGADLSVLLLELRNRYSDHGVHLVRAGKTWGFRTASDLAPLLRVDRRIERKLSRAAVETLSIIAYHQPVTRAEVEEIRGVQLGKGTLDVLLDQGWIRPKGRRQTPGRPVTWATTETFLDHFGLESLSDLPGIDELKAAGLLDARPAIQIYGARSGAEERAAAAVDGEGLGDDGADEIAAELADEDGA